MSIGYILLLVVGGVAVALLAAVLWSHWRDRDDDDWEDDQRS